MNNKQKIKKVLRWLIILVPYLIHYFRLIIQLIDELSQEGTLKLLKKLELLEEQQPIKQPEI